MFKTPYEQELQDLKPHDEVQYTRTIENGYQFIGTAGHGYLIVPTTDSNYPIAKKISSKFGYNGKLAVYLEEDCDATKFIKMITI